MLTAAIIASPAGLAIWIIIVAAVAAIVFVALKTMGVAIPGWVVQVFWILVVAVVCILAIKFLVGAV
jgi:hypothetical protein